MVRRWFCGSVSYSFQKKILPKHLDNLRTLFPLIACIYGSWRWVDLLHYSCQLWSEKYQHQLIERFLNRIMGKQIWSTESIPKPPSPNDSENTIGGNLIGISEFKPIFIQVYNLFSHFTRRSNIYSAWIPVSLEIGHDSNEGSVSFMNNYWGRWYFLKSLKCTNQPFVAILFTSLLFN